MWNTRALWDGEDTSASVKVKLIPFHLKTPMTSEPPIKKINMGTDESSSPASFPCWIEGSFHDRLKARSFYSQLLGLTAHDSGEGTPFVYTRLRNGESDVCGISEDSEKPSAWSLHFSVSDCDEWTVKAKDLGAKVIAEPFDVMTYGRMSVIQDSQGAFFNLWQSKEHSGTPYHPIDPKLVPGFGWTEMYTNDIEDSVSFYSKLFSWEITREGEYVSFTLDGKPIAGLMKIQKDWGEVPPCWTVYFIVDDVDKYTEKIKELGGTIIVEPKNAMDSIRFVTFMDDQKAVCSLYHPLPSTKATESETVSKSEEDKVDEE
ncbi:hypothetical protein RCL1_005164 [Eukaryota sp. TZLM3-RCL]